ncbi:MAG TPA: hypothetical protein VHG29_10225 [Novosphingobium sp.]|nr:hypothetical protein [Novosphingobium sp.]
MTIDPKVLNATAAAFEALDLTPQNEQISAIRAEIERIQRAEESALDRSTEIDARLGELRHPELQAMELADDLLAGVAPTEAADAVRHERELREERDRLRGAVRELRQRIEAARNRIKAVEQEAIARVQEIAAPLAAAIASEAREAAEQIREAYAALFALSVTANAGRVEERMLTAAVAGIFTGGLVPRQETQVPPAVSDALALLAGKGPALRFRAIEIAPIQ